DVLLPLVGKLREDERAAIAHYLRSGSIVFALMEHTWDAIGGTPPRRGDLRPGVRLRDVVGGAFDIAGGSAVLTDGTYHWRRDAAEYVEHYGVELPDDFLRHGRSQSWSSVPMSQEEILAVDRYLHGHMRPLPRKRKGA